MTPRRILILSTQRLWYGGEEQARQLAQGLTVAGHDCTLMVPAASVAASRLRAGDLSLGTYRGDCHGPRAWPLIRRAALGADIVHTNDPRALTAASLALAAVRSPPIVAARRVTFRPTSPWVYRRLADRVVCASAAIADACERAGVPRSRLRVVLDGVDPARIDPGDRERGRASLALRPEDRAVVCVASLNPAKGIVDVIDAARQLVPDDPTLRFFVAGDGAEMDSLRSRAAPLGRDFSLLGYREDVPDLLAAADVFVMASRSEGLGSSVIDAMLAGPPIVATRAGGIPEMLTDNGRVLPGGTLVAPADPAALAAAIRVAAQPPTARRRLRQHALDRFTGAAMTQATLEVYREVLA